MDRRSELGLLTLSVFRKNRRLTLGLFLLFFLMTLIVITVQVLPGSVTGTVEDFLAEYGMPEGWITTGPMPVVDCEVEGIRSVEAGLAVDMFFRDAEDRPLSLRVFRCEPDSGRRFYEVERAENVSSLPAVRITCKYAETAGIRAGDILSVEALTGPKKLFVEALVSLPEGLVCVRDDSSWQDGADFGYAYLSREDFSGLFGASLFANQWNVRFEDGLDTEEKLQALRTLAGRLGAEESSAVLLESSELRQMLDMILDALRTSCRYFPMAIFIIGLFFSGLFVRQLVLGNRKKIGLLRALGYSVRQIVTVFLLYTVLLCLAALLPGAAAGALTVRIIAGIFQDMYALPAMVYRFSALPLALLLLGVLLTGVLSCLSSARQIASVAPAEAYGDLPPEASAPPRWFASLRAEPFVKTAFGSILRNRSRFLRSAVSICACIVLMIGALLYRASQNEVFPVTFGGRYTYDFTVSVRPGAGAEQSLAALSGISQAEPVIAFRTELSFGGETGRGLVNALCEEAGLITPSDREGERLLPGDGVVLDEWTARGFGVKAGDRVLLGGCELTVTGVARELVNSTEYISLSTAARMGQEQVSCVAVRLEEDARTEEVLDLIADLPGCTGVTQLAHQESDYRVMIRLVNIMLNIVTAIPLLLGIVILYNMVVLNLSERRHPYATLSALGAGARDFLVLAVWENLLLYVCALLPAVPLAVLAARLFLTAMSSSKGGQYLPIVHLPRVLLISAALSLIYLIVGVTVTLVKILKTDPAADLNIGE